MRRWKILILLVLAVLSFFAAQLGIRVDWDEANGRVTIVFPSDQR